MISKLFQSWGQKEGHLARGNIIYLIIMKIFKDDCLHYNYLERGSFRVQKTRSDRKSQFSTRSLWKSFSWKSTPIRDLWSACPCCIYSNFRLNHLYTDSYLKLLNTEICKCSCKNSYIILIITFLQWCIFVVRRSNFLTFKNCWYINIC